MHNHRVQVLDNVWIPMWDGCRLAAKIRIPEGADSQPVPALLEYLPYRKRDFKALRDSVNHAYFAQHGYVCVRVDLRGSGDSEGILRDEYLEQELIDGLEVLRWIASQPWCSGSVGMFGLSWGGFNSLQIAALDPPELGAIITVCSSDDRYNTDVHYKGGTLLTDNLSWASTMFAFNSMPPDPEVTGERWRKMWLERLENNEHWLSIWLKHQRRDEYWQRASVCEGFSRIRCPVFAVGGWADGYTNTVFHLMEHLEVPRMGLVGPWGHKYPHMGGPGPTIGFLQESIRWWDRWLKGIENGIENEPIIRAWMQDAYSPFTAERPGRWVAEREWPSETITSADYRLSPLGLESAVGRSSKNASSQNASPNNLLSASESSSLQSLSDADSVLPSDESAFSIQSPLSVGLFSGRWYSTSEDHDLPGDQRLEDGGSLVFDSSPLDKPIEILGAPKVTLCISADKPVAQVAVRLSSISPDGAVSRITYGLLNLTQRNSQETCTPLQPGERYTVVLYLNHIAQRFPEGHRLRLAISSSYWPLAWPAPEEARLTVFSSHSSLTLPIRLPTDSDCNLKPYPPPEMAEPLRSSILVPEHRERKITHDLKNKEVSLELVNRDATIRLDDIDLVINREQRERFSYEPNWFDTLRGEVSGKWGCQRNGWSVRTETRTVLTSTKTDFRIQATLDAFEGEEKVFAKSWDESIPRDGL